MFVLAELRDTIRIHPDQFNLELSEAIRDEINRKLANKVLLKVGLCIALKDVIHIGDSIILPGDGASHTEVTFRYIVFRPSISDIVTGKIRSCSRDGVHVTLGFFDDIIIPPASLQHPSRYEEAEQAWVWDYATPDGETHEMFMDIGETLKFRVSGEIFEESSPIGPVGNSKQSDKQAQQQGQAQSSQSGSAEIRTPYRLIGAINEQGLGILKWWNTHSKEGDEDGKDGDSTDVVQEQEDDEGAYEE